MFPNVQSFYILMKLDLKGNENNFESPEDCEATCKVGKRNIAGKDPVS